MYVSQNMNQQHIDKIENDSSSWTPNKTMNDISNNIKLSDEKKSYFNGKQIHLK